MSQVIVRNLSNDVSEAEIRKFFSFCGHVKNISVFPTASAEYPGTKEGRVEFEKPSAASTALLLNGTRLGSTDVVVEEGGATLSDVTGDKGTDDNKDTLSQEDKPRAAILAELLAQGYVLSDNALNKGIELDKEHGISSRFTDFIKNIDSKFHVSENAAATDKAYDVSGRIQNAQNTLQSYLERVLSTPAGNKVKQFYTDVSKTALDIHNEARRLADEKEKEEATTASSSAPAASTTTSS